MALGALVGRDREMGFLEEDLRVATGGRRAVVLLTGEPGIGKTRLLEELAERVGRAGGRAVWGRTWEVGPTPSFWPWRQVFRTLGEPDDHGPDFDHLDARVDALARLDLFAAAADFLSKRARQTPLAILLDDMHAADPGSLLLFEYLARSLRETAILFVATARDGDASGDTAAALGRISREARRIALGRLGRREVESLVGARAALHMVDRLYELSEGNPLFVEELLVVLPGETFSPISGVRVLLQERVGRLSLGTAEALRAAALLGREFRAAVVADVLGISSDDFSARLAPAHQLGLVTKMGGDAHRFSHALVAEAIADELPLSERAALHLRAAQALERRDGGPEGASAIAHHLLEAGNLAAGAAVDAAEHAASGAMSRLAFEDAASLLERALRAHSAAFPDDRARKAALLVAQGEARQHAGQHDRARELCREAAELARALGDSALLARVALAQGLEFRFGSTDATLVALLTEALGRLPAGDSPLRARMLARLSAAEQPAREPKVPMQAALDAVAMARRLGEKRTLLDVIHVALAALIDYASPDVIDQLGREVLALATEPADRAIAVHTLLRLCFTPLLRLDRIGFEAAVDAHAALARSVGRSRQHWHTHMLRAMSALLDGRFADAGRAADEAETRLSAMGDVHALRLLTLHRSLQAWTQTVPFEGDLLPVAEEIGNARAAMIGWHALVSGRVAQIPVLLTHIDTVDDANVEAMVAAAIIALDDRQHAIQIYPRLLRKAGRIAVMTVVGFAVQDFFDRLLLGVAAAAGHWDAIDEHARSALAITERLGAVAWAPRVRADWASALDRRGRPSDRAAANTLWAKALAEATRLEMRGLIERCRAARPVAEPGADPEPLRREAFSPPGETASDLVTATRSGALWELRGLGSSTQVPDSRGMAMLARLLAEPGREWHALDVAGATAGAVDRGDAGASLDPEARAAYQERVRELRAERDQAEAAGDMGRVERATDELGTIEGELVRAFGLGGRERRAGAAVERARSNVQRRLSHALQQIRAASPRLGEHLTASIRTGTYCVYRPASRG